MASKQTPWPLVRKRTIPTERPKKWLQPLQNVYVDIQIKINTSFKARYGASKALISDGITLNFSCLRSTNNYLQTPKFFQ
jgi:hypothetical protein